MGQQNDLNLALHWSLPVTQHGNCLFRHWILLEGRTLSEACGFPHQQPINYWTSHDALREAQISAVATAATWFLSILNIPQSWCYVGCKTEAIKLCLWLTRCHWTPVRLIVRWFGQWSGMSGSSAEKLDMMPKESSGHLDFEGEVWHTGENKAGQCIQTQVLQNWGPHAHYNLGTSWPRS